MEIKYNLSDRKFEPYFTDEEFRARLAVAFAVPAGPARRRVLRELNAPTKRALEQAPHAKAKYFTKAQLDEAEADIAARLQSALAATSYSDFVAHIAARLRSHGYDTDARPAA